MWTFSAHFDTIATTKSLATLFHSLHKRLRFYKADPQKTSKNKCGQNRNNRSSLFDSSHIISYWKIIEQAISFSLHFVLKTKKWLRNSERKVKLKEQNINWTARGTSVLMHLVRLKVAKLEFFEVDCWCDVHLKVKLSRRKTVFWPDPNNGMPKIPHILLRSASYWQICSASFYQPVFSQNAAPNSEGDT